MEAGGRTLGVWVRQGRQVEEENDWNQISWTSQQVGTLPDVGLGKFSIFVNLNVTSQHAAIEWLR
jgi:hypothetical protein